MTYKTCELPQQQQQQQLPSITFPGSKSVTLNFYVHRYHELFRRASHELFEKGMTNFNMRENEIKAFDTAVKEEKDVITATGRKCVCSLSLKKQNPIETSAVLTESLFHTQNHRRLCARLKG